MRKGRTLTVIGKESKRNRKLKENTEEEVVASLSVDEWWTMEEQWFYKQAAKGNLRGRCV